jgi:trehalose 6-phosphate synthase
MSRLVAVSNRISVPRRGMAPGGLAVGLLAAMQARRGMWFGWDGDVAEGNAGEEPSVIRKDGISYASIDFDQAEYKDFYLGFCNGTLWPLFHYFVDGFRYDDSHYEAYQRMNQRYARALAPLLEPDDLIWVHDYHLIPVAQELRKLGVDNPIGFFLHIPWPAPQLLVTLPNHRQLVEALFAFDLIGLQTGDSVQALTDYVVSEAGGRRREDGRVEAFGRTVRVSAFPIGLDFESFTELSNGPAAIRTYDRMAAHSIFRSLIVGVERLDYSKGLEERLAGFERFLERWPERARHTMMIQIAPTSRDNVGAYQELRDRLSAKVGDINSRFALMDWSPIRYINRGYSRAELAGVYRAAKVGLVTPLRDGMNLVAKEYVAAQLEEDPGVLILSRFAGAASQLPEALIVNPYDPDAIAEALFRAVDMPIEERRERHAAMLETVRTQDVRRWRDDFVDTLKGLAA